MTARPLPARPLAARHIFVTGATGLIAGGALAGLLRQNPALHATVLVRDRGRWVRVARSLRIPAARVTPLLGDITRPGLGLSPAERRSLAGNVNFVLHAAADTTFSQTLKRARTVNSCGTAHVVELAESWPGVRRFVHVSTAFVVGRAVGRILDGSGPGAAGWVNAYERSKCEAEVHVRTSLLPYLIFRPSTIVCDDQSGAVTQVNAVHRALHLYHAGLASLMPGSDDTPVDVVTTQYVAGAIAELALAEGLDGRTLQLCAGKGAMPLGELLDRSHQVWSEVPSWNRRRIPRPALTDLETYRLFEEAVEDTGDARLRTITRSLSHFVPQLAYPKRFDTTAADRALGYPAPRVHTYWPALLRHLLATRWGARVQRAG